jgi:hypothetical protein
MDAMICFIKVVLALLFLIAFRVAQGFVLVPTLVHDVLLVRPASKHTPATTTTRLHSQSSSSQQQEEEEKEANDGDAGGMKLVYPCHCSFTSEPLPVGTTEEDLWAFFRKPQTRNLIFSGGGKFVMEQQEMTSCIHEMWQDACEYFESPQHLHPSMTMGDEDDGDVVMAVSLVIEFPGLQILTTSLNGIKLLSSSPAVSGSSKNKKSKSIRDLPQFHSVLLGEKQHVTGSVPMVWLYKRITGLSGAEKKQQQQRQEQLDDTDYRPSMAKVQSLFSVIQTPDDTSRFAFCLDCNLTVTTHVPKHLVRLLAMFPKEKIEALGTAAVSRVIPQGVASSVISARLAFEEERKEPLSSNGNNSSSNKKVAIYA